MLFRVTSAGAESVNSTNWLLAIIGTSDGYMGNRVAGWVMHYPCFNIWGINNKKRRRHVRIRIENSFQIIQSIEILCPPGSWATLSMLLLLYDTCSSQSSFSLIYQWSLCTQDLCAYVFSTVFLPCVQTLRWLKKKLPFFLLCSQTEKLIGNQQGNRLWIWPLSRLDNLTGINTRAASQALLFLGVVP